MTAAPRQDYKLRRLAEGLVFPESPRWHQGRLWLVDMHGHKVLAMQPDGRMEVILHLADDRPSAVCFMPDGTPIVTSARKRLLLKIGPDGKSSVHRDLSGVPGENFNDMVIDGKGRIYLCNRFSRTRVNTAVTESRDGVLLVPPDGEPREVATNVYSPNGSVVSADGKTFIIAMSRGQQLLAFDIEADGSLTNRRVFANLMRGEPPADPLRDPSPDGICLDAKGGVWFGSPRTGEFLRVVEGGTVTDRIELPKGRRGVACMLGGPDRRSLYLLSADATDEIMSSASAGYEAELRSASRGFVDVTQVEVAGVGWP